MPAGDTRSRNLYQKLVTNLHQKLTKMQVHHSLLHQNNSPANHVAWFVSCARQFLWWNRAGFYCVQETSTRKKLVPDWLTHVQVSGISFLSPALEGKKHLAVCHLSVTGWLSSVLRPRQHSIGYMGDDFYRSKLNQQYQSTEGKATKKKQKMQTTK